MHNLGLRQYYWIASGKAFAMTWNKSGTCPFRKKAYR